MEKEPIKEPMGFPWFLLVTLVVLVILVYLFFYWSMTQVAPLSPTVKEGSGSATQGPTIKPATGSSNTN